MFFETRKYWIRKLLETIVLLGVAALAYTTTFMLFACQQAFKGFLVGVYFYPWYSSDGRHWNASIDPTWTVVEEPIVGFYDSRDEEVIRWQLRLIRDAGIDFIAVSWWGPGSFEDNATKTLVRYIREYGLKFAILVEPYLGSEPILYDKGFWERTLGYIKVNFIEPYGDAYLHLYGKPLVLAFNPIGMVYRPHQDFVEFAIRIVGNDIDNAKYQDWDYWPDYLVNASNVELRIRADGMVSIVPRFCDTHFKNPGTCIDPDLSWGFYREQWEWILKNSGRVSVVMITSWNEYHERTHIEPSYSDETRIPWLLYNTTREYIGLLRVRRAVRASICILIPLATTTTSYLFLKHLPRRIKY